MFYVLTLLPIYIYVHVKDDMQKGVHSKFVDMSTSVREAAVELIGRFVLNKPELILQYYDMIIERILVSCSHYMLVKDKY